MKYCSQCGIEYEDSVKRCPEDGTALLTNSGDGARRKVQDGTLLLPTSGDIGGPRVSVTETLCFEDSDGALEKTSEMAREIEDLILKVCSHCHSAYHGDIDVCPEDGTRLIEPSVMARHSLFVEGANQNQTALFELKKFCHACNLHFDLDVDECEQCGKLLAIPTLGGRPQSDQGFAAPDSLIGGKYRILSTIDSGGFGCVHLAKHESLGKRFAIKVLRGNFSDTKEFRNRFHEEALKLSRLEDENIVKVFDFGESENSQYMVTEYVDGKDLGAIIYEEKVSPVRAAKIMRQIAAALAEAHSKKIVHLDLKPRNILVTHKRGKDLVKVIDFGIAEIYSETGASRQETVAGTCTYMAPEQWRRRPLDPRTDIYSFGVIFYELLAGRPPFRQTKVSEIERAHLKGVPPPLRKLRPDVPVELDKLIQQCLEKKPEKRVQSAEELEARLQDYVGRTENVLRRWVIRAGVAAVVVVVLTGIVLFVLDGLRDKVPPMLTFDVHPEDAAAFKLTEDSSDAYMTYRDKVRLSSFATDDREVDGLIIELNGVQYSREDAVAGLPLSPGDNRLRAYAFDTSRNRSPTITRKIHRLAPPTLRVRRDLLEYTNESPVELFFAEFTNVKARVECRIDRNDPHFVESVEQGDKPVEVDLRTGRNIITITSTEILNGGDGPAVKPLIVNYFSRPIKVEVITESVPGETVEHDEVWLTSAGELEVIVRVDDAARRLSEGADLSFRVDAGVPGAREWTKWTKEDLADGEKRIPIGLTEGDNDIRILTFTDRFGNESTEKTLKVVRDTVPPVVTIRPDSSLEYYEKELPRVRFEYRDEMGDANDFALLDLDDSEVNRDAYEIVTVGKMKELRFLDDAPFAADGAHSFELVSRDLVGNPSRSRFTILVDQNRPEIVEIEVPEGTWKRGDQITLRMTIEEAVAATAAATVRITVDGVESEPFPMDPKGDGVWEMGLTVDEHFKKPRTFDSPAPGFDITFTVRDLSGKTETGVRRLHFAWENGDRFMGQEDGSTLVYHEPGSAEDVDVEAFFIQESAVSNRQWADFLAGDSGDWPLPHDFDKRTKRPIRGRESWPVRGVTPREAKAYTEWAHLELATKNQWLVAAFWDHRERRKRKFPWGLELKRPLPICCRPREQPVAVDAKEFASGRTPSPFRLRHMFGNVWEITLDRETGKFVIMGGAFRDSPGIFEKVSDPYIRGGTPFEATDRNYATGFRCTLSP